MGGGATMTVNMLIALDVLTWSYGHLSLRAAVHTVLSEGLLGENQ